MWDAQNQLRSEAKLACDRGEPEATMFVDDALLIARCGEHIEESMAQLESKGKAMLCECIGEKHVLWKPVRTLQLMGRLGSFLKARTQCCISALLFIPMTNSAVKRLGK